MRLLNKVLLGAAALATATAATFPLGFGEGGSSFPGNILKREALKTCQQESRSFVSFLASDRDQCYREMRAVGMANTFSGVWSKPDRAHMRAAQD
jgi:hypothetical protein